MLCKILSVIYEYSDDNVNESQVNRMFSNKKVYFISVIVCPIQEHTQDILTTVYLPRTYRISCF